MEKCRNCKSVDLKVREDEGDTVCKNCGLVTGYQLLDSRSAFVDNELQFNDIYGSSKDRSKNASSKKNNGMSSLFQSRKMGNKCLEILTGIRRIGSSLRLTHDITEYACSTIQILDEIKQIPRKYDVLILSGAAIFHSCHKFNLIRTIDEIAQVAILNKMEMSRACTTLKKLQAPFESELLDYVAINTTKSNNKRSEVMGEVATKTEISDDANSSNISNHNNKRVSNRSINDEGSSKEFKEEEFNELPQNKKCKPSLSSSWIVNKEETDDVNIKTEPLLSKTQQVATVDERQQVGNNNNNLNDNNDDDVSTYAYSISSVRAIPEQIIPRFCHELKIKSKSFQSLSCEVSKLLIKSGLLEAKQVKIQAACSIYMALLLFPKLAHIGIKDIMKVCSLSSTPFKKAYTLLFEHWRLLIPNEIQNKIGEHTLKEIYEQ